MSEQFVVPLYVYENLSMDKVYSSRASYADNVKANHALNPIGGVSYN